MNSGSGFNISVTPGRSALPPCRLPQATIHLRGLSAPSIAFPGLALYCLLTDRAIEFHFAIQLTQGKIFDVSSTVANYKPVDASGNPLSGSSSAADIDFGFNDLNNRNRGLNKPSEIKLTLSGSGVPSNLGQLALDTGVLFDGAAPDDFAIFVTGSGAVSATLKAGAASEKVNGYPASPFRINFSSDTVYSITDIATSTVVATRLYTLVQTLIIKGLGLNSIASLSQEIATPSRTIRMAWVATTIFAASLT